MTQSSNLEVAIRAYTRGPLGNASRELASFAAEPTLEDAVSRAALAVRFNGKRLVMYAHQRRVPRRAREASRERLVGAELEKCASFHELFQAVEAVIRPIAGIGELTVYDTALRIGAKLGLEPDRVYLHAGTRVGIRHLGLDWHGESIPLAKLPHALQTMRPWQVEDILCIYKAWFGPDKQTELRR
jgi:hypothetical protein